MAIFLVVVGFAVISLADAGSDPNLTSTTFTDTHGRTCTTYGTTLDCDYPPAENRLGGWLDNLDTQP